MLFAKSFMAKGWWYIMLPAMIILMATSVANAQKEEEDKLKNTHQVMLALGHANLRKGVQNGTTEWLALPAWSFNYNYWLGNKWAIGLHTDMIIQKFEVDADVGNDEPLERDFPIAPALMGVFKPTRHSAFLFGAGVEFAKEENLFLNRAEYEWSTAINHKWEVAFSLSYDFRWNAYDSCLLGFNIIRLFRPVSKALKEE